MIKCNECGHDNEIQRVYCHNCGARLDRAALVEEAQKPQKVVKPKRVSTSGGPGKFVGNLVKTLLFAAIAAALLEACRAPDGVPSSAKTLGGEIIDAPSLSMDLETAAGAPARFAYSAAQLNAYLKNRIKAPKDPKIPAWAVAFDSVFLNLEKDSFRLTKKWLVLSQPVYTGGTYVPLITATGLTMKPLSGNIGRLPIPGVLFDLVDDFLFADFAKNMKEESKGAGKMQSIQISPKKVVITSGPSKP